MGLFHNYSKLSRLNYRKHFHFLKIKLPQSFNLTVTQGSLEVIHEPKKIYHIIVFYCILYQHKPIEATLLKIAKMKEVQAPWYECQRSEPQKQD